LVTICIWTDEAQRLADFHQSKNEKRPFWSFLKGYINPIKKGTIAMSFEMDWNWNQLFF
jgi:hypothetical protein